MNALPIWTCEFSESKGEAATPMANLTVGSKFAAKCKGDIAVEWTKDPVGAVFPSKESAYTLVVLGTEELTANSAEFTVTGYKAGEHAPEYVRFVQGTNGFEVSKPTWNIQSVLPKDQQQPPQPVPPFGPWSLALPMWIIVALVVVLSLIAWFTVRYVRRSNQRSRMLKEIDRHKTPLSPVNQFYRDARNLRKRLNAASTEESLKQIGDELDREFRLYILRQFQIPTLEWSDRAIADDLRKRHRKVYKESANPLRKTLRELGRLTKRKQILLADVEQLHRMSLDTVERIEAAREASQKKGLLR